jgi:hypothetical protein
MQPLRLRMITQQSSLPSGCFPYFQTDVIPFSYYDRQENVGYEVRAGLSSVYATHGWVADDVHSESASRTLDYACLSVPVYFVLAYPYPVR